MFEVAQRRSGVVRSTQAEKLSAAGLFDISLSVLLLVVVLPLMLLVACCIWVEDGGSVFFIQDRVGRGRKIFRCLKFRSMQPDAELRLSEVLALDPDACAEYARNKKLARDPRVTIVGAIIRRYSIDELPQLFNVVRGEMSLVGPRPIMVGEILAYGSRIRHYCTVRPGITGLWQISGRSHASFRKRVAMDVIYLRSKGVLYDLKILAATIPVVMGAKGSY